MKKKYHTPKIEKKERFQKRWNKTPAVDGDVLVGTYSQGKWDFGFVDVVDENGDKKGYYVHSRNKATAMEGDEVSFTTKTFRWKAEAEIVSVIKRAQRTIVWELQIHPKGFAFVVPSNPSVKQDIFVHPKNFLKAKNGQIVGVEITDWSGKNPEGKVVKVLGNEGDKGIDVFSLALEWGARIDFPEEVILDAKNAEKKHVGTSRKDLTKLFTFTIDGEDAKDLDDAISLEKKWDMYVLYVHIADVTHYVRENSPLDKEALERGTSIYLTDRVIPMLPEELSNGVCSLNADGEKATLTCEMLIGQDGEVKESKVYESLIHSNYRLTYRIVETIKNNNFQPSDAPIDESWFEKRGKNKEAIIEGLQKAQKDAQLLDILQMGFELKRKIENHRRANGYLEFDFFESKILIGENGDIIGIGKREKLEANKLIEHFMVSANEAVGRKFSTYPFLYRIHPDPQPDDVEKAIKIISNYVVTNTNERKGAVHFTIERAIEMAKGNNFLSKIILRSLTKAIYSTKNEGHFWLGLDFYSHFTSPIRRYPDLQIHRIIKEKLSDNLQAKRVEHYKHILPNIAKKCSDREQLSEDIERKVDDLAKVKYMSTQVGKVFDGTISGMIAKWFFVELENTVEWFVDVMALDRGGFTFLEDALQLKNFKSWEIFKFWDTVKVKVARVDLQLRRVDFELIS